MSLTPFIQTVLERVDLVQLIQERVTLKRAGGTYTGCCPFHQEKTPSFHVYHQSDPPHYHCFGCGAHGDAISFIRDLDHLEFMPALEQLAQRVGLEVPKSDPRQQREYDARKSLFQTMEKVSTLYEQALQHHPQKQYALDYLKQRGVSAEMIKLYRLGFAPPSRNTLAEQKDVAQQKAFRELKLVHEKPGNRAFDMFSNRLMFPIRDRRGRVVAFGGRTLGDDRSKYINSSETPLFVKRQELFGLWETRQQFRQVERLIVVEGYLDVIAITQAGIPGAVAMMGTATNEESLQNLLEVCPSIIFCFDGDRAGLNAADKAMQKILPLYQPGQQIEFLILPEGEDPDSFIQKQGAEAFRQAVEKASPLSRYFLESQRRDLDIDIPEQKALWRKRAYDLINPLKGQPIHGLLKDVIYEQTAPKRFQPYGRGKEGKERKRDSATFSGAPETLTIRDNTLVKLALACLQSKSLATEALTVLTDLGGNPGQHPATRLIRFVVESPGDGLEDLVYSLCTDEEQRQQFKGLFNDMTLLPSQEVILQEGQDALKKLRKEQIDRQFEETNRSLATDPGNPELKQTLRNLIQQRATL